MKKKDQKSIFTKEQKAKAVEKIKNYLEENFEIEPGNLQTEIFLEFLTKTIGVYYYNNAIADSLALITEKAEDLYLLMKDEE